MACAKCGHAKGYERPDTVIHTVIHKTINKHSKFTHVGHVTKANFMHKLYKKYWPFIVFLDILNLIDI